MVVGCFEGVAWEEEEEGLEVEVEGAVEAEGEEWVVRLGGGIVVVWVSGGWGR